MITKQQAVEAQEFHWGNCTRAIGKRGGIKEHVTRARRNGRTQTWKRDAARWRVPIKLGLYQYGDITNDRAHEWHVPEDCPLAHTDGALAVTQHQTRVQTVTVPILKQEFYRGVCTCNWTSSEFMLELEAQRAIMAHIVSVDQSPSAASNLETH